MEVNLAGLRIDIDGDKMTFEKMIVYSPLGTIELSYHLEKRSGKWVVVALNPD